MSRVGHREAPNREWGEKALIGGEATCRLGAGARGGAPLGQGEGHGKRANGTLNVSITRSSRAPGCCFSFSEKEDQI